MLTNNDVMKKLRVALKLKDTDILEILKLAEFEISATELSAFFRNEEHQHYRPCGDQVLRRFLDGLIVKYRGKRQDQGERRPVKRAPLPPMEPVKPLARHVGKNVSGAVRYE